MDQRPQLAASGGLEGGIGGVLFSQGAPPKAHFVPRLEGCLANAGVWERLSGRRLEKCVPLCCSSVWGLDPEPDVGRRGGETGDLSTLPREVPLRRHVVLSWGPRGREDILGLGTSPLCPAEVRAMPRQCFPSRLVGAVCAPQTLPH